MKDLSQLKKEREQKKAEEISNKIIALFEDENITFDKVVGYLEFAKMKIMKRSQTALSGMTLKDM